MTLEIDRQTSLRQIVGRLHDVVHEQEEQVRRNLDRHGVTVFRGEASFTGRIEVTVRQPIGQPIQLAAGRCSIAVGSSPHRPNGVPFDDPYVEDVVTA